jgi:hypothetical protein
LTATPQLDRPASRASEPALRPSLRSFALAAVAARIAPDLSERPTPEVDFLHAHLRAVCRTSQRWSELLPDYLRRPLPGDLPLLRLAAALQLEMVELLAVALAAAVEDDLMAGRAVAHVQAPVGGSRPTLGLCSAALADVAPGQQNPIAFLATGAACRSGLLVLLNENLPLPERALSVPNQICLALAGFDGFWPGINTEYQNMRPVPLPDSVLQQARRHAGALLRSPNAALVLRTGSKAEGQSVATIVADAMELRPAFIQTDKVAGLGPWLLLREFVPVFSLDLAPAESRQLPAIPLYQGPIVAIAGPDGSVENPAGSALHWTLPVPSIEERAQLWRAALHDESLSGELAARHRHGAGRIAHLGDLARHHSALEGRSKPAMADIRHVSWISEGAGLDSLAQPLPEPITSEALVMPPALESELRILLLRCGAREGLVHGLGPSATTRYRQGVRALFVGPSGTGKTLAAGWLATELGMPLYRVDLASVTSKYIGETEKNLAQLLARAEQSEVILLFDEADSLFGKRTDVKDANDRFANAQTNYLLQRIETYDGITLLTSNSRARFDAAFSRRLDFIIEFPLPGPEERRALWQSHLGPNHRLTPGEINRLAAEADLAGGHIRNAVLAAALPGREENRPITYSDVLSGVAVEFRKLGRLLPAGLGAA